MNVRKCSQILYALADTFLINVSEGKKRCLLGFRIKLFECVVHVTNIFDAVLSLRYVLEIRLIRAVGE